MSEYMSEAGWFNFAPRRGALVETPSGIRGWVTYHSIDGWGINVNEPNEEVAPTHMLRDSYLNPTAECIGEWFRYVEDEGE